MTVDNWVLNAVEAHGEAGAALLDLQRHIDEYHYEELAVNTINESLIKLVKEGRLIQNGNYWHLATRTSKDEALKKLFGSA
jgi:hypothetical protein